MSHLLRNDRSCLIARPVPIVESQIEAKTAKLAMSHGCLQTFDILYQSVYHITSIKPSSQVLHVQRDISGMLSDKNSM